MRIPRCAIVIVILSAVFMVGCGGGDEPKPVDLKGTINNSAGIDEMKEQMIKNRKSGYKAPNADAKK